MRLTDTPEIQVNGIRLNPAAIDAEVQYHPMPSRREAMEQAAQTLIIGELLRQRAIDLGLVDSKTSLSTPLEQQLIDQLLALEVYSPEASENECRQYYQANLEKFTSSPLLEVRHILRAADPEDMEERAREEKVAQVLVDQLQADINQFDRQAAEHSACSSASLGGQLGQISKGQTVPEFERQVFAADEGLMSRPVESRYGFHVVDIVRKVPGKILPYDAVAGRIQSYLNEKVSRKASAQYIHQLIAEAEIEGFEFNLEASPLMQ